MTEALSTSLLNGFETEDGYHDSGAGLSLIPLNGEEESLANNPQLVYEKSSSIINASIPEKLNITGKARQALNAIGFELLGYAQHTFNSVEQMNEMLGDRILYLHIPARRFMKICGIDRHYSDFRSYIRELKSLQLSFDNNEKSIDKAKLRYVSLIHDISMENGEVIVGLTNRIRREFTQSSSVAKFNVLTAHQKLSGKKFGLPLYEFFCQYVSITEARENVVTIDVPHFDLLRYLKARYRFKTDKKGLKQRHYGELHKPSVFQKEHLAPNISNINEQDHLFIEVDFEKLTYGRDTVWRFTIESKPQKARELADLETRYTDLLCSILSRLGDISTRTLRKKERVKIEDALVTENELFYVDTIISEAYEKDRAKTLQKNKAAYILSQFNNEERRQAFYENEAPTLIKIYRLKQRVASKNEQNSLQQQHETRKEELKREAAKRYLEEKLSATDESVYLGFKDRFMSWYRQEQSGDINDLPNEQAERGFMMRFIIDECLDATEEDWDWRAKNSEVHAKVRR